MHPTNSASQFGSLIEAFKQKSHLAYHSTYENFYALTPELKKDEEYVTDTKLVDTKIEQFIQSNQFKEYEDKFTKLKIILNDRVSRIDTNSRLWKWVNSITNIVHSIWIFFTFQRGSVRAENERLRHLKQVVDEASNNLKDRPDVDKDIKIQVETKVEKETKAEEDKQRLELELQKLTQQLEVIREEERLKLEQKAQEDVLLQIDLSQLDGPPPAPVGPENKQINEIEQKQEAKSEKEEKIEPKKLAKEPDEPSAYKIKDLKQEDLEPTLDEVSTYIDKMKLALEPYKQTIASYLELTTKLASAKNQLVEDEDELIAIEHALNICLAKAEALKARIKSKENLSTQMVFKDTSYPMLYTFSEKKRESVNLEDSEVFESGFIDSQKEKTDAHVRKTKPQSLRQQAVKKDMARTNDSGSLPIPEIIFTNSIDPNELSKKQDSEDGESWDTNSPSPHKNPQHQFVISPGSCKKVKEGLAQAVGSSTREITGATKTREVTFVNIDSPLQTKSESKKSHKNSDNFNLKSLYNKTKDLIDRFKLDKQNLTQIIANNKRFIAQSENKIEQELKDTSYDSLSIPELIKLVTLKERLISNWTSKKTSLQIHLQNEKKPVENDHPKENNSVESTVNKIPFELEIKFRSAASASAETTTLNLFENSPIKYLDI